MVFARGSRDPLTSPTTADHWHAAYTVYNCGAEMPPFLSQVDPDGIHSHGDSLIHIHPYNSSATGADARLGVFFDTMMASVNVEGIFADNGEFPPILAQAGCDGGPGVISAARWQLSLNADPELIEVYEDGFDDIRLLADGEGFSFALVAVGDDPPPPSQAAIAALVGVGAEIQWQGPDPLTTTTLDPLSTDTQGDGSEGGGAEGSGAGVEGSEDGVTEGSGAGGGGSVGDAPVDVEESDGSDG